MTRGNHEDLLKNYDKEQINDIVRDQQEQVVNMKEYLGHLRIAEKLA